MLTHAKRKHRNDSEDVTVVKKRKTTTTQTITQTEEILAPTFETKEVSTTTSGLGLWNSSENLSAMPLVDDIKTISVFTSTENPISTSKSAGTSPLRITKDSSTSIHSDEPSDITAKKISSWNGDFDDAMNLFDNDSKLEFFSTETQTDFTENLFHNNYTQTTFNDLYDFVKFDNQTQTNWNDI